MKILIGSKSNFKKEAVENILSKYSSKLNLKEEVSIETNEVKSDVPETPYNEQAFIGAKKSCRIFIYK